MEQVMNENTNYRAAVYCRLSKDVEPTGESVSIETQKLILMVYCVERGYLIHDTYVDDGYSGLNYDRPAFQRMLTDIDEGKVNLVVTKDLSRLGRDYIQTGYYTDVYFSRKHVRYIAVNDGIDTIRDDNDIAPFKNILNDMYARDLSRKVKSAKRQRANKGYYISAQTPYGYKVDPKDRNHLIVDEEAAEVVREIFRLALAGNSLTRISDILTARQITTPGNHKTQNGDSRFLRYQEDNCSFGWCYQTVRKILRDQVYTGDMVNHKYEIRNYKTKERTPVPKEKWIIVADRHEPIVSRDVFERTQQKLNIRHRPKRNRFDNAFGDLVYCAECKSHMNWMMKKLKTGETPILRCANHFQHPNECRHNHMVYYEELYAQVSERVRILAKQMDSGELLKHLRKQAKKRTRKDRLAAEREKLNKRLEVLKRVIKRLYEDMAGEVMSAEDCQEMLSEYSKEQKRLHERLAAIEAKLNEKDCDEQNVEKLKALLDEVMSQRELTGEVMSRLIERIEIGHTVRAGSENQQEVTIYYRFIGAVEDK